MLPFRKAVLVAGVFAALPAAPAVVRADENPRADVYQIIRATPNRVWRLNKQTGEITVCTFEGDHLVCIPGVEASKSQVPTLKQIEAERARAASEAEQRRKEERAKQMAVLDRMIAAFRQFIQAAMEADEHNANK